MRVRDPGPDDLDALLAFFAGVPEHERTFFREPVLDRAAVDRWLAGGRGRRAIAIADGGALAGYAAVVPLPGWSDHVGELRLVVAPGHRRAGVGRALARWALVEAVREGLGKVVVEVVADQEGAVAMFSALGFRAEGLLRDHVRDRAGELRDLVLLAHPVTEAWEAMATIGLEAELG